MIEIRNIPELVGLAALLLIALALIVGWWTNREKKWACPTPGCGFGCSSTSEYWVNLVAEKHQEQGCYIYLDTYQEE